MSAIEKASLGIASAAQKFLSAPVGSDVAWGVNDAPILIVLGQSNSYGHGTALSVAEQITTPMTNVFTLTRTNLYNLTFTDVTWSGMTTLGVNNVATPAGSTLGAQDHTVALSSEFARLWQAHITAGNSLGLPNLYVIEAGWGSQGMSMGAGVTEDRWSPDRSATDVESLFPRITKTVRIAVANLKSQGKNPRIIAVHWNQWETDASTLAPATSGDAAQHNFSRIIEGFNDALGCVDTPWVFYYPLSTVYGAFGQSGGVDTKPEKVRKSVLKIVEVDPVRRRLMDTRNAPTYTGVGPNFGVFHDNVHYTDVVQKWFASTEFARVQSGWRGVLAGRWPQGTQGLRELSDRAAGLTTSQVQTLIDASSTQTAWQANVFSSGVRNVTNPLPAISAFRVGSDLAWSVLSDTGITPNRKVLRPSCPSGGNKQGFLSFTKAPTDSKYGRVRLVARGRLPLAVAFRAVPVASGSFQGLGYGYAALSFYDFGALTTSDAFGSNKVFFWTMPTAAALNVISSGGFSGVNPAGYVVDTSSWREWEFGLIADNGGTAYIQYRLEGTTIWTTIYSETGMDAKLATAGLTSGGIGLMVGLGINDGATQVSSWASTYGSLNLREFQFIPMD